MDFVILKVNGKDVSNSSHEEAVEVFLSAHEPIMVEVKRRGENSTNDIEGSSNRDQDDSQNQCSNQQSSSDVNIEGLNISNGDKIQTDDINSGTNIKKLQELFMSSFNSNLINSQEITEDTESGDPIITMNELPKHQKECNDFSESTSTITINPDALLTEDFLTPTINYDEIVLCRASAEEKLGLTLCYETDNVDGFTDIFIDDIHPDGLAKRDGRLRLGDQIIQIDGEDVRTKPEAQESFMRSKGDITLLVARPPNFQDATELDQSSPTNELDEQYVFDDVEESLLLNQSNILETSFIQNLQGLPTIEKLSIDKTSNRSSMTAESSCCDSGIHAAPLNTASTSTQSSTKSSETSQNNESSSMAATSTGKLYLMNNNNNDIFNGEISNSKHRKDSSSSSAKDSGKHDETLNTSKSSNSNSSCDGCDYKVDDDFCFIGSNNFDKDIGYVNKMLKDVKLPREPRVGKQYFMPQPSHAFQLPVMHAKLSEPIYETIPELTENEEQQSVYAFPVDDLRQANTEEKPFKIIETKPSKENSVDVKHINSKPSPKDLKSKFFPLNIIPRKGGNNKIDQSHNLATDTDIPQEREKKIKEVERWLKLSMSDNSQSSLVYNIPSDLPSKGESSISPQQVNSNKKNSQQQQRYSNFPMSKSLHQGLTMQLSEVGGKRSMNTSTSNNEIALNSLANAKKIPKVQQRRIIQPNGKMPLKGTIPRPASLVTFTPECVNPTSDNMISYTNIENLESTMRMQQEQLLNQRSNEGSKEKKQKPNNQHNVLKEQYQKQQEEAVLMRSHPTSAVTSIQSYAPVFNPPPPPPLPPTTFDIPEEVIKQKKKKTTKLENAHTKNINESVVSQCNGSNVINTSDKLWEWKVKIRKDGTRYVTRRPSARSDILKEREMVLNRERMSGMTTDDDAMSELKVGKYWPKETRKLHLAQAKEHRRRIQSVGIQAGSELDQRFSSNSNSSSANRSKKTEHSDEVKNNDQNELTNIPCEKILANKAKEDMQMHKTENPSMYNSNLVVPPSLIIGRKSPTRSTSIEPVLLSVTTV